jgi:hypothetical protein
MQVNRMGIVAAIVAFFSRPVLWLVGVGMVVFMWLRPGTRRQARQQLAKWGGWSGLPRSAWRWATTGLSVWPFAVVAAAGAPALLSVLISWSFAYVPLALAVALLTAMIVPSFDDEIAARFGAARSRHGGHDE